MSLKIIFAGTPEFAAASLKALCEHNYEICAVYTQPDRPAGRGKRLVKSAVKECAERFNIPIFQPDNLKTHEAQQQLADLKADLMIVAAYGLILPQIVLDTPRLGCVNIHASLLPRWRGAAPIQRAIQAGDKDTGITIMQMDAGLDTGGMLLEKSIAIENNDTGGSLHDRLMALGATAILEYLENHATFTKNQKQQNDEQATYAHKLSKQEAKIDWSESAEKIERTVRAFNPWPVSYFEVEDQRVRVLEAKISNIETTENHSAGQVIAKDKNGVTVQCGSDALTILKLQLPGAKAQTALDFHNGGKSLLDTGTALK